MGLAGSKTEQNLKDAFAGESQAFQKYSAFAKKAEKEGFANIPQRTVAHLVQGAAIKIDEELNGDREIKWITENHDSLLMQVPANNWEIYGRLMKKIMLTLY